MLHELDGLLDAPFRLRRRPSPIAGDMRIAWGTGVVLLILKYSRGRKASFQKLHFLGHAVRSESSREHVLDLLMPGRVRPMPLNRIEPWINRAANYCVALGLSEVTKGRVISLTDDGNRLADGLLKENIFEVEMTFLKQIGSYATEKNIDQATKLEVAQWE
jgi:hypothetical protein